MKNATQSNCCAFTYSRIQFLVWIGILVAISTVGCRQPVSNPGARSAMFDLSRPPAKLFGGTDNASWGSRMASKIGLGGSANSPQANGFGGGGFGSGFGGGAGANSYAQGGGPGYTGNVNVGPVGVNPNQYSALAGEVQGLNQRLTRYDADNQLLNTEVASLQQKLQLANQYNNTLKQQLSDTSGFAQQSAMERQAMANQIASLQASSRQLQSGMGAGSANVAGGQTQGQFANFGGAPPSRLAGGATIRANNSLMQGLSNVQIPGGQARMDGDLIRIEFPSDNMFVPGTYQIQPAQLALMQNIVGTIRQSFPKQIMGIEAHWDNTPLNPPTTTQHQLTATQALAVFDNLVRLGLPKNQMFTMAMASNRPRHPKGMVNGVSPNRRIELVIYPESYDGSY